MGTIEKVVYTFEDIIGYEDVKRKAQSIAKHDENVLILGETGVGKKLFASAIHNESRRKDKKFLVIDCPAIQTTLFESELFGHKKGSFTDAREDRVGMIEEANEGSVYLDEIGNLSLECQAKLLRVIEEKRLRRIGENVERKVDVRFIFATNKDLKRMVKERTFMEDLFYRIATFILKIPPLRNRKEDLVKIANHYWEKLNGKAERLNDEEIELLLMYHFPGNIRELQSILKRTWLEWKDSPALKRADILRREIEREREWREDEIELRDEWVDTILKEIVEKGKSFWDVVYMPYLRRELNRYQLKKTIIYGLEISGGSWKALLPYFHIEEKDYKKFMDFLRKQGIRLRELKVKKG